MAIWTEGTAPAQKIQADYPGLGAFPVELEKFKAKLGDPNRIYLMDPLGNILMFYTLDKAGKPMLKDIKFLLKKLYYWIMLKNPVILGKLRAPSPNAISLSKGSCPTAFKP